MNHLALLFRYVLMEVKHERQMNNDLINIHYMGSSYLQTIQILIIKASIAIWIITFSLRKIIFLKVLSIYIDILVFFVGSMDCASELGMVFYFDNHFSAWLICFKTSIGLTLMNITKFRFKTSNFDYIVNVSKRSNP